MKKILDSKFLFIIALSLIVLIILGVGAFYLFNDADDAFVKSGYVLNPLSAKSEKYFFNENTEYKENLSSMIIFKDIDDNDASILKDSFIHYNDGSLSFLKNGAILDLDSINKQSEAVNFYNITNKSIIEQEGNGYVVRAASGDVGLRNFIGRISDDKYIVVGSLEARIPGNEKNITGDYFEIVYAEEGIVNIENKDVKYQVTAQGTIIYAGDVTIDLGAKKITKNGEDVMSITAVTINGNENIEIIPVEEDKKENEQNDNSANNENPQVDTNNGDDGNNTDGSGNGTGGTGKENIDVEREEGIIVSLKDATVGSTNVNVTFDIYNQTDADKFTLKVTNLESGRTADVVESVLPEEEIRVNLLSPNTKYLFTVINENDNNKYFQKIFETNDFGIKLEKSYATNSELGYKVTIAEGTDITNAKLSLYKYNEETKKNEIVTTSYYDSSSEKTTTIEKVTNLSNMGENIEGVHEIIYDGLDSNTIYTAVLDEFSVVSSNFKDVYNITLTSMTLKETPTFNNMIVDKDMGNGVFKLSLNNIEDPDNAIQDYTYMVYEYNNPQETIIDPIVKSNASPVEIKVGNEDNQLKNDTNYFYKVIILYYDNEKYIEYIMDDTITFVMGSDPYITVVPNENMISYDRIGATIYLTDNSCLISMPGREKCNSDTSNTVVEVYKVNSVFGEGESEKRSVFFKLVDFEVSDDEIKYELDVDKLQAGTTYEIVVRAYRNDQNSDNRTEILHSEKSKSTITTKSLASFVNDWVDKGSSANHVINLESKFIPIEGTGTMSSDETASSISKVVLKLYQGNYVENLQSVQPIAVKEYVNTDDFNIKENFYDSGYVITSDEDFDLDIDSLKQLSEDGKLSEYYTMAIYAYYDRNGSSEIMVDNNIIAYKISPILLIENINEPKIMVDYITKKASGIESNLINDGTCVGFSVNASFDRDGLLTNGMQPREINMYVYNADGERVKFYIMDSNGNLTLVDKINSVLGDSGYYDANIYMGSSTEYFVKDTIMSRGNAYYIGYEIIVDDNGTRLSYPNNNNEDIRLDYGVYAKVTTLKETPNIKMYIANSTSDTITYRYELRDPDNAVYRDSNVADYEIYYVINDGSEKKVSLNKTDGEYNIFTGDVTLTNLNAGDIYSLYLKANVSKSGEFSDDVVNYFNDKDDGKRIFDGYYDLKDSKYNVTYEVINHPLVDNKVYIKMLADQSILDRIISYRLKFTDANGHNPIEKELWHLQKCQDDSDDTPRCFSVDYLDLKPMKSENNLENLITVTVDAIYDNGLTGYDYTVGDGKDYKYMIMQNNLVPDAEVSYIAITEGGSNDNWDAEAFNISRGYYTYSKLSNRISYHRRDMYDHVTSLGFQITASGYLSNKGIMNPKMISIDTLSSDNKTFSFNSITPKIQVTKTTSLINGAVLDLMLSSADIADFCEENSGNTCVNKSNSEFYLYIETWDNMDEVGNFDATVIPTVKVKINNNNTSESLRAVVSKVMHGKNYYYNIYADMNKDGRKQRIQLFDAGNRTKYLTKTYTFTSLSSNNIYHSFSINYRPNPDGEYGDKLMTSTFNLIAYKNNINFNFDFAYVFCNLGDENCGVQSNNNNIFKREIAEADLATTFSDTFDISEYELLYDKNYTFYAYVVYDYYDTETNTTNKYYLRINTVDNVVNLKKLSNPYFVVERKALYADDDYLIEFNINVSDTDHVLENGKYFVKLIDENNEIVGDLQVKDNDGSYITVATNGEYGNYAFDAIVTNKTIRIKGLEADTKYTIYVYSMAYINNYSLDIDDREVEISKSHSVYSTNNLGVALGDDVLLSPTANSVIVTFLGGSNFDNVSEVTFTRGIWDSDEADTFSITYVIGENNKRFEISKETGDWYFVINPNNYINVPNQAYKVTLQFVIKNPETGNNEYIPINTNLKYVP